MDDDDYEMQFDDDEPQHQPVQKSPASKVISALNPEQLQSHTRKSQTKIPTNETFQPKSILTSKWRTGSTKALSTNHGNQLLTEEYYNYSEEQLKRENLQLQIKIKALEKQITQHKMNQQRISIQTTNLTQISGHTQTTHTTGKLKRQFNLDSHIHHLNLKYLQNKQVLFQQSNVILKIKNRQMQLTNQKYLFDLMKKCEEYAKYVKKLQKYVSHEKYLVEGDMGEGEYVKEKKAHKLTNMRDVMLYRGLELEKLADREGDLEDRLMEAQDREREVDDRLKQYEEEIQGISVQEDPANPLAGQVRHLRREIQALHKNLKVINSSFRHKTYILSKQRQQLQRQVRRINRQGDDQDVSNYSMLERLKKYLQDVSDEQVLRLGNCLLNQLQTFPHKSTPKTLQTISSKPNLQDDSQNFTRGIIRLKRRVAASQKKHQQTLIDIYKPDTPIMTTQFPSLVPSARNLMKKRPTSLLSLTAVDDHNTSQHEHVKFSYW